MSYIEALPHELWVHGILLLLPLRDMLSLFQTNKLFAGIGRDEMLWKRRLQQDFNFTNASSARSSGFKFLYRKLNNPKVYVWGEHADGRLGRPIPRPKGNREAGKMQYWPLKLSFPGSRIVELVSGGWSFSAIDTKGHVYVWGRLSDLWTPEGDDFFQSGQLASKPLRLGLSTTMRTITCGRSFMTGLDSKGEIWCFTNWGRPFIYAPSILDRTYQGSEITQVECGWSYSAALTASGMVVVWNPINEEMKHSSRRKRKLLDRILKKKVSEIDGVIQCYPWTMKGVEALVLPELPSLPSLNADQVENYRLIKIAAGDLFIIGLTNGGHVLKLDLGGINERDAVRQLTDLFQQRAREWQYLPMYSERSKMEAISEFREGGCVLPQQLEITHISAHYLTFVAYSTGPDSIVLMGRNHATPSTLPTVIRSLQNRGVISVVLGDYHWGALLENGELLTWGGAHGTGLGDPCDIEPGQPGGYRTQFEKENAHAYISLPDVRTPAEVRFDHDLVERRNMFVFGAAAGGWHMGALVIGLDEEEGNVES